MYPLIISDLFLCRTELVKISCWFQKLEERGQER